ncbi:MAG: hypothetical protein JJ992_00125 [Planctomycetes bacterium]|nr:hypothetical protein [Planctomycetota bacterium]
MRFVRVFLLPLIVAAAVTFASASDESLFELRSTTYFVYSVTEGETVEIDLRPRISSASANALPGFQVLDQSSRRVRSKRAFADATTIRYRASTSGINALVLEARRHWCQADFGWRPFMICAKPKQPIHFRKTPGPLFFYVPADAEEIELAFCCPDNREGGTIRVLAPDETVVFEQTDWFHEPTRIRVAAKAAQRGQVWAIETDDPKRHGATYAIDDVLVYFTNGALPFVSRSADDLRTLLRTSGESAKCRKD